MNAIFQTRPHRLSKELYRGQVIVAFTCCVKDKKSFLKERNFHSSSEILFKESTRYECDVLAYVFMPDHCHILLQGKSDNSDTLRVIQNFKQKSGYWFAKNFTGIEWQKSFYDHILRSEEEIDKHIGYILDNPVRKGLCEDWKRYPWKGSMVYDLNEWCP